MAKVKAIDKEDGDLTSKVKVEEVDTSKVGTYIVTYTVTNSKAMKEIAKQTVTVTGREEVKNDIPILKVPSTTTITKGDEFNQW